MIRHYTAMGLQLLGLILTGEALLLYFGEMGPMMTTASVGAGLFYAGWMIQPRAGRGPRKPDSVRPSGKGNLIGN